MKKHNPWRLSIAPMLDWTDTHCRYFHRLITKNTRVYTEMINTGAILHGYDRFLEYHDAEHPIALQLGGNNPKDLAKCAALAQKYKYDEVNINCGCPSDRVKSGAFGAILMKSPKLVADAVAQMIDAAPQTEITVKHRIGLDKDESYDFVRDFVGTISNAGCKVFIVHARNAWLNGVSPKDNRDIPPLRYDVAYKLKKDFSDLTIVINGGINSNDEIENHLNNVDGVMIGRAAYNQPWIMNNWDEKFFGAPKSQLTQDKLEDMMCEYIATQVGRKLHENQKHSITWTSIARHILGLHHGRRGARYWRQILSDHKLKDKSIYEVSKIARQYLE